MAMIATAMSNLPSIDQTRKTAKQKSSNARAALKKTSEQSLALGMTNGGHSQWTVTSEVQVNSADAKKTKTVISMSSTCGDGYNRELRKTPSPTISGVLTHKEIDRYSDYYSAIEEAPGLNASYSEEICRSAIKSKPNGFSKGRLKQRTSSEVRSSELEITAITPKSHLPGDSSQETNKLISRSEQNGNVSVTRASASLTPNATRTSPAEDRYTSVSHVSNDDLTKPHTPSDVSNVSIVCQAEMAILQEPSSIQRHKKSVSHSNIPLGDQRSAADTQSRPADLATDSTLSARSTISRVEVHPEPDKKFFCSKSGQSPIVTFDLESRVKPPNKIRTRSSLQDCPTQALRPSVTKCSHGCENKHSPLPLRTGGGGSAPHDSRVCLSGLQSGDRQTQCRTGEKSVARKTHVQRDMGADLSPRCHKQGSPDSAGSVPIPPMGHTKSTFTRSSSHRPHSHREKRATGDDSPTQPVSRATDPRRSPTLSPSPTPRHRWKDLAEMLRRYREEQPGVRQVREDPRAAERISVEGISTDAEQERLVKILFSNVCYQLPVKPGLAAEDVRMV